MTSLGPHTGLPGASMQGPGLDAVQITFLWTGFHSGDILCTGGCCQEQRLLKLVSPSCARGPSAKRSTGSVSLTPARSPPVAPPDGPSSWGPAHNLPLAGTGRGEVERLKGKKQLITMQLGAPV